MENSQTIQNEALNTVIHVKIWAGSYLVKKIPKIKYKKIYLHHSSRSQKLIHANHVSWRLQRVEKMQ